MLWAVHAGVAATENPPALRLLVATLQGDLTAAKAAREAAAHGSMLGGARRPVEAEVRYLVPGQTEQDFARQLRPALRDVDVVYVPELYLARAIQMENATVPIVFDGIADAVGLCLVDSLRRPGRNATGYMHQLPAEEEKLVETLVYGFPDTRKIVYLLSGLNGEPTSCSGDDPVWLDLAVGCVAGAAPVSDRLRRIAPVDRVVAKARALGVEVEFIVLCEKRDIAGLARLAGRAAGVSVIVPWHLLFVEHADELVATIGRTRRPALYARHSFTAAGGVMSMEPTLDPQDDRASIDMLLQVLDGRRPATLPVQTPRGFSIRFNASAATQQGLRPSLQLLRRADEILQVPGAR